MFRPVMQRSVVAFLALFLWINNASAQIDPDCTLQSFTPVAITSATITNNGQVTSKTWGTTMTLYAPCGPGWTTYLETITAYDPRCGETQTRIEHRLTSTLGEVISTTAECVTVSPVLELMMKICLTLWAQFLAGNNYLWLHTTRKSF